jgi:hypothetical protein
MVVVVVFFGGSGDGDNITADKGDVLLATLAIFLFIYMR